MAEKQLTTKEALEALELDPNKRPYSEEFLKKRFKEIARKYHPDNQETGDDEKFKLLVSAKETLEKGFAQKVDARSIKVINDLLFGRRNHHGNG